MSCYEWSHGTIKLPSAEFAKFRQAIQTAETKKVQATFDASQSFWKRLTSKQKADPEAYLAALNELRDDVQDLHWLLRRKVEPSFGQRVKPSRVLKSDLEWSTNRTTAFHDGDLTITFDQQARTVSYSVGENNHAREWADKTAIGQAFNDHIGKVRWTHGTGGVILGNDEYSREAGYENEGGGGSYAVAAYGYLGIQGAPTSVRPFVNAKGQRIKAEVKTGRYGFVGKPVVDAGRSLAFSGRRW